MATNTIHPETAMGAVRLRAADIEAMRGFYERAIGLSTLESGDSLARLGVDGDVLVELVAAPDAAPRPNGTTGLFHLALLVPDRERLGAALRRVGEAEWALTGASDHLVSEALYTRDPEGNGIEIYRDRPQEEWRRTAAGELEMDSLPLDLDSIAAEGEGAGPMAPGTHMGHVHLNVADVADSDDFYSGLVGFEPTVRSYPGALFVSAGGYHHHLGLNTWAGEGAAAPEPGSLGLESFDVIVPDGAAVDAIASRLSDAGQAVESTDGGIKVADPSSNVVLIRTG